MKNQILFILAISLGFVSCSPLPEGVKKTNEEPQAPVQTITSTFTPTPTVTPSPTNTNAPTMTATLTPTVTFTSTPDFYTLEERSLNGTWWYTDSYYEIYFPNNSGPPSCGNPINKTIKIDLPSPGENMRFDSIDFTRGEPNYWSYNQYVSEEYTLTLSGSLFITRDNIFQTMEVTSSTLGSVSCEIIWVRANP